MRAVVLEIDERMIAERRRLGLDRWDESWEGVLHVVPPPSERHQGIEHELAVALHRPARRRGLRVRAETGVFASDQDYRVPDLVVFSEEAASGRGVDGAPEIVIEIRSPGDESDEKVPWYLARGAKAVLVVDRDSLALQLSTPTGRREPADDGSVVLEPLGIVVRAAGGTLLVDGVALDL